jgi:formylglycine-generating enzyme
MTLLYWRDSFAVLHLSLFALFLLSHSASAQIPVEKSAKKPAAMRLISPNGGEVFVSGSDTVIVWDGVPAGQSVTVECSTDAGRTWMSVAASVSGSRCAFRVPVTTIQRDSCLVRLITRKQQAIMDCMVTIPAGSFRMGNITNNPSGLGIEKPVHDVTITRAFLMSCSEVTQAQWKAVTGNNPSNFKGDSLPVEEVSWYDAVDFCNLLSKEEGFDTCYTRSGTNISCDFTANGYRLPTEAEWEYACRGGMETDFYTGNMTQPTGNDPVLNRAGWYDANSGSGTHDVVLKEPNAFGLYDMHGNVWEWCWDGFDAYPATPVTDPHGLASGTTRVLRGGSWLYNANLCRSSMRSRSLPNGRYNHGGFRLVRIS